jgi:hypothetical protein
MVKMLSARMIRIRGEFVQFGILTRHFFGRLFRNDIVDFEDEMKARLVAVLSVLAVIIGWSSQMLLFNYNFTPDVNISWQEKNYLFILIMILFGIVTLLEWEMLFPDRQDFVNLTPLPVRLRTVFGAKLASFIVFIGLFSAAMNSISSVVFSFYLAQWRSNSLIFVLRHIVAHLLSSFAACFCMFFACVFINFLLMAVLPSAFYRRISLLVRLLLIAFFVFLLLSFLAAPESLGGAIRSLARLKDHGSPLFFRIPSLWFVGLYEVILGTKDPSFIILAKTAGLALALSIGAFGLACALSYFKHVRATLETAKGPRRLPRLRESASGIMQKAIFRSPEERAISDFFSKTIRSSPRHRVVLANYVAFGGALVMLTIVANRRNLGALTADSPFFLAQSLLLDMVLLFGIRAVAGLPAAFESHWVFRATESARKDRYVSGLKKVILLKWFLPLATLIFLSHLWLWADWRSAFNHAVFGLVISGLGIEALFFRFRKIPFASSYVPGKLKLQTRAIPYLFGCIALLAVLAFIERGLLKSPSYFWIFFIVSTAAWLLLRMDSARFIKANPLIYEEEPEPAMIGFPDNV